MPAAGRPRRAARSSGTRRAGRSRRRRRRRWARGPRDMDVRPAPPSCLALIHEFEQGPGGGFAPIHYLDDGVPKIGYGHSIKMPAEHSLMFIAIGQDKADELAEADLADAAGAVCRQIASDVVAGLSDGQYAALVDLMLSMDEGQFSGS